MKYIVLFVISFIALSCQKGNLELTLLNDTIVSVDEINYKTIEKTAGRIYIDTVYDNTSRNIVKFKLTNNSNEKYYIYLDENYLGTLENDIYLKEPLESEFKNKSELSFNLYRDKKIINGQSTLTTACGFPETELEYYKSKFYRTYYTDSSFIENIKKRKLYKPKYQSILSRSFLSNCFVLNPGESRYFTSIVNLPLRKEGVDWISFTDTIKPNLASLSLRNISSYTKKYLSADQKKTVKENNYIVFDGTIVSNKVPIKYVKMPINK